MSSIRLYKILVKQIFQTFFHEDIKFVCFFSFYHCQLRAKTISAFYSIKCSFLIFLCVYSLTSRNKWHYNFPNLGKNNAETNLMCSIKIDFPMVIKIPANDRLLHNLYSYFCYTLSVHIHSIIFLSSFCPDWVKVFPFDFFIQVQWNSQVQLIARQDHFHAFYIERMW